MRDASRYLETGEIGRLAFKPKDKGSNNVGHDEELENDRCDVSLLMIGFFNLISSFFQVIKCAKPAILDSLVFVVSYSKFSKSIH